MTVWIVGRARDEQSDAWELMGVFDSEDQAVRACSTPLDFVGPVDLNRRYSDTPEPWVGAWFPCGAWEGHW